MNAVALDAPAHGGAPPRLRDADLPAPRPGPGEALVRVAACGFSRHDALILDGVLRRGVTLPRVLGHEAAGIVEDVGDGVAASLVGAPVVVLPGDLGHRRDGAFAEMLAAPADTLVPLDAPPNAARALLASPLGVAVKAVDACALQPGSVVVVTGASGGLGAHAAQVARAAGSVVVGLTGSSEKADALEKAPWLDAVLLDDDPWEEAVAAMTGDAGADAALDTVGASLSRLVVSLRRGGRLVLAGQVAPGEARLTPAEVIFRELTLTGSLGAEREHVERALRLLNGGALTPVIDSELPLSAESVMAAYGKLHRRETLGRIVLRP